MVQQKNLTDYNYKDRAEKCFRSVLFSSLATTDGNLVWISPLWIVKDNKWNLYFKSKLDSRHVKNIEKDKNVSIAIYDSNQIEEIFGLQISGVAEVMNKASEISKVLKYYHPDEKSLTHMEYTNDNAVYKLIKIIPNQIFIFDQKYFGNRRIQIPMDKLVK